MITGVRRRATAAAACDVRARRTERDASEARGNNNDNKSKHHTVFSAGWSQVRVSPATNKSVKDGAVINAGSVVNLRLQ